MFVFVFWLKKKKLTNFEKKKDKFLKFANFTIKIEPNEYSFNLILNKKKILPSMIFHEKKVSDLHYLHL